MGPMNKRRSYKLTAEQKQEIWKLYNDGFSPKEIAEKFEVSRLTVYRIGNDEKYKN
jgi:DNA invertase Pin-like site-specific DNA recombinase